MSGYDAWKTATPPEYEHEEPSKETLAELRERVRLKREREALAKTKRDK